MRDMLEFAQRTSGRGRGKAVLVYPAERMNAITANALLKTLEEPPGDARFVLATEAAHQLLPTIRSRCQAHALAWPEAAESEAWLAEQGVPAAALRALLRAAGGRPADALRLHQAGLDARAWSQWPQALVRGDTGGMAQWTLRQTVDAFQKLCHDLLAMRCGAAPRFFEPAELPAPSSVTALTGWWQSLARTARTVDHPLPPRVDAGSACASEARAALNSRDRP